MKLICVVKYVPDVDNFSYAFENTAFARESTRQILNPDDSCAVAFALKIKALKPSTSVEVVTMSPLSVLPHIEDLVRMGVDRCVLLADRQFAGSDTYTTSFVLAKYLSGRSFDCVFTGTQAIDGDTSHIPAQVAQRLDMAQLSNIVKIESADFNEKRCTVVIENEQTIHTYEVVLPAILSLTRESGYKLPYVKRADMYKDVSSCVCVLNHSDLAVDENDVGTAGSLTKVAKTYTKSVVTKDKRIVSVNDEGVETVFKFLRDKGLLK